MHILAQIPNAQDYTFTIFSLPTLLTMTAVFLLGLFVLVRERISTVSLSFFAVTFTVSIWLFCFSWVYASNTESLALSWAKAAYIGIPFIAPATYGFTTVVLGIYKQYRVAVIGAWLVSAIFAATAILTDNLVISMQLYPWGYYTRFHWLGSIFVLFFGGLLVASMFHYWTAYKEMPQGKARRRVAWLMVAFGVGYLGIVDFVAVYGIPLYPFGYLAILAFVAIAARAIWAYHLEDITPAFAANQIIETMNDALLVLDREGILRVANRAATELFGYDRDELVGKPLGNTIGGAAFARQLEFLIRVDKISDYEMTYSPKSGGLRYLSIAASVMRDADNEPVAIVCIAHDITQRRLAEEEVRRLNESLEQRVAQRTEELQRANSELENEVLERKRAEEERTRLLEREQAARANAEEASHAREILLSIVSHDLRNPLSAIKSTVSMLQHMMKRASPAKPVNLESLQPGLARIDTAANKMGMLINELLDFAQLQVGQPLELFRRRLDLVALCNRVAEEYQQGTRRHRIVVKSSLPELTGLWDPMRLERVLDNLISNAIKYSPNGGQITLEIERPQVETSNDGAAADQVTITVRDEGVGIPERDLPHIFDWFKRAANVTGRIRGTGIGLAVVQQVVEQHGGTITAQSVEGSGSAFVIKLPLYAEERQHELSAGPAGITNP